MPSMVKLLSVAACARETEIVFSAFLILFFISLRARKQRLAASGMCEGGGGEGEGGMSVPAPINPALKKERADIVSAGIDAKLWIMWRSCRLI